VAKLVHRRDNKGRPTVSMKNPLK